MGFMKAKTYNNWRKVSDGFAYRMKRLGDSLYVSGMGSPNRVLQKDDKTTLEINSKKAQKQPKNHQAWLFLKAPHMFRDAYLSANHQPVFFLGHSRKPLSNQDKAIPSFSDSTFYSLMLTLHDGTFFADWWVWVNDAASVLLIVLLVTGIMRWSKRIRWRSAFRKTLVRLSSQDG